jgi:hypothetical protein
MACGPKGSAACEAALDRDIDPTAPEIRTMSVAIANLKTPLRCFAAVLAAFVLAGCMSPQMGPRSIGYGRESYNQAIKSTNDQELLLNLVRSRYRDTLYFTNVERVAATLEFNQTFSLGGSKISATNLGAARNTTSSISTTSGTPSASLALNEKPTVFYAPVEGEKFVRQMMTPMNPDSLLLFIKSGWSFDRVFAVAVQDISGIPNAPTASGPQPSFEPEFRQFHKVVRLLRSLQREGAIDFDKSATGNGIDLVFLDHQGREDEIKEFKELLKLDPKLNRYKIVIGAHHRDRSTISIITRPLLAAMNLLSTGIEIPEADTRSGKVRVTKRHNGEAFDWKEMMDNIFTVKSSPTAPGEASVSIYYRGSYFYIADDDLDSKSTFLLLSQLISLNVAPATATPGLAFSFGK